MGRRIAVLSVPVNTGKGAFGELAMRNASPLRNTHNPVVAVINPSANQKNKMPNGIRIKICHSNGKAAGKLKPNQVLANRVKPIILAKNRMRLDLAAKRHWAFGWL